MSPNAARASLWAGARSVRPRIDTGQLVALTDLTMPQPNAINAYLPKNRPTPPHVRAFISLLTSRLRPGLVHSPDSSGSYRRS